MKATALIVMLMATALVVSAANSQEGDPAKSQQQAATNRIKELQKERLDVLSAMAESAGVLAKQARVSLEEACEAQQQLLQAQIEYADNDAQRVRFYESYIEVLKKYEEYAKARKEGARGTEIPILKAKAGRLGAEISIEQLKAKR